MAAWRLGRDAGRVMLLVPADVLAPRRPDEHFTSEAATARDTGITVALIDHDALTQPDGAGQAVARVPAGEDDTVYRGWMLNSQQYAAFAAALSQRDVTLRTTAGTYQRGHELPGWFPALAPVTPPSVWTTGDDRAGFDQACRELGPGPAVVRDYTKSMKHYWHEAAFIPDLDDAPAAWQVASRFRQLRDEDFTGGFVLRRFEHFTSAEVRTWWVNGTCALTTAHPDTPGDHPPDNFSPGRAAALIAALELPFVTADFAQRDDGAWRLIELGDGQVSDRPATTPPHTLITALQTSSP